ncbi:MAG: tetratricopeptide repeat protein [Terracidiphilus sp.]
MNVSFKFIAVLAIATASLECGWASNLTITLPRHSELSPVQRLNREGVEAVKQRQYQKAEELFYKAYLYDPADPFTLNNLGFISEQKGELDRAHKFYELASEQSCAAQIDLSSEKALEKKPMSAALDGLQYLPMRINRMNVEAMRLLSQDRAYESVTLLQQAIALDPRNPFTLNNLGVADEAVGDFSSALRNYRLASATHSVDPVLVTSNRAWAGKPVSAMAEASATRLEMRLKGRNSAEAQAAVFSMRGVYAANQNNWQAARQNFLRAYSLDPASAFSLNNRGYVAERDGDLESAQFFYQKARRAEGSNDPVGLATEQLAQGRPLFSVATDSDRKVDSALDVYSRERHRETGPVELTPRGNGSVENPSAPKSQPAAPVPPSPTLPSSTQPSPQ